MSFAVTPKAKGDEEKVGTGAPASLRGGPDARDPPRPADRRAAALRASARSTSRSRSIASRAASASRSSSTSRACRTSRRSARSRAPRAATRSRPAAAASSATAVIVLEPLERPPGLRVRRQDRRRRDPAGLPPGRRQGHPGGDAARRARRRARPGPARPPRSTARTTRSTRPRWRSRSPARWRSSSAYEQADPVLLEPIMDVEVTVPDEVGRRRQRRPQLTARPAAGHGAGRRDDDDQGRGADVRDPHLLAVPDVADGRSWRLSHVISPATKRCPTHIAQKIIAEAKQDKEEAAV